MKTKLMTELFKWGVMTAIVAVAMPELASADTIKDVVTNVTQEQLPVLPYAMGAVCYVGGSFMMVSGALSLRKHAENPAGEPVAKGVSRLLTGGVITAVPALTRIVQETTTVSGSADNSLSNFNVSF